MAEQKTYVFADGTFQFYVAKYGSWNNDCEIIFRVRMDSNPAKRAQEKGITGYDRLYPATESQVNMWLASHKDFKVRWVITDWRRISAIENFAFYVRYFKNEFPYLRYGQAFLNTYFPGESDPDLYYEKDHVKALTIILSKYVEI